MRGRSAGSAPGADRSRHQHAGLGEPAVLLAGREKDGVRLGRRERGELRILYVQSLDDGSVRRFTTDPADDLSPVWSPDGTRIAWLRTGRGATAVFVANVAGGTHAKIADVYPIRLEAVGRQLDWSPDGEYLAAPDKSQR